MPAEFDRPAETGRTNGESAELREAFMRLSVDHRALLVLHHLHGYGVREIGEWLGVPTGTVKWRMSRARGALRSELERDR
jgi:RNA polymerase sigma-70 factor (ECF subfamily)